MEEFGSSHEQRNHIYIVLYSIISIRNNATVFCIYLFKNIKQMTQILKNRFVKKSCESMPWYKVYFSACGEYIRVVYYFRYLDKIIDKLKRLLSAFQHY